MNKINPICERNCRLLKDSTGNKVAESSGKYKPNKEGPKMMPASISPITTGCLILLCGTSNTSFVGFPLVHALLGEEALNTAIIVDQSNLIVLFTLGILVANLYSGKSVCRK